MVLNIIGRNKVYFGGCRMKTHLLHHNIDVMHIEKNVFMNKEFELKDISRVKIFKPKPAYTLTKSQRVAICKYVNLNQRKLHGMKSHDCYIFMQ
ncbi:hypothetical protein CR513_56112, partial [Mucuna pruriens]